MLRALPAEVTHAEAALSAAQHAAAAASDALSREETLRNRLERDIAVHRQKTVRLRVQLDSVTTSAQAEAMEHEIAFAAAEVDRMENEEFASLERSETQEGVLAAARGQVEVLAGALDKTRERGALRQQELTREMAAMQVDRDALRKLIDPEWLTRYDRLAASRGTGLARAEISNARDAAWAFVPRAGINCGKVNC